MANDTATFTHRLTYTDADGVTQTAPNRAIAVPYSRGAVVAAGIDIPDATTANTSFAVPFSSISEATGFAVKNDSGGEISLRLEPVSPSATGTLSSGTATIAFPAVAGERLSVELVTAGGTPGILSVKRSSGNVIVQSWLLGTGIQTADTSTVKVYNNAPLTMPNGAALSFATPSAASDGPALGSAIVSNLATQTGAAAVAVHVVGDPV